MLAGEINEDLARRIQEYGGKAQSLNFHTTNVLFGQRLTLDGPDGKPFDLGHVGKRHLGRWRDHPPALRGRARAGHSLDVRRAQGQKLNVNADTAATAVAQALQAEKMVYLSDVNGVRRDKNDPDSLIHSLTAEQARELISSGAIDSGMIPKVQACLDMLDRGVRKIHIIDGRLRHSLLLEVFTSKGVGTEIVKNGKCDHDEDGRRWPIATCSQGVLPAPRRTAYCDLA